MNDFDAAIQIFQKYLPFNPFYPMQWNINHLGSPLIIVVDPDDVTVEDLGELFRLGFKPDEHIAAFRYMYSIRRLLPAGYLY